MIIKINLNGTLKELLISPDDTLLDVLRKTGCLSVKKGCESSSCGVCTVLLDGTPILSCSYLAAKADGHSVTTVEGIAEQAREIGEFIAAQGADQCGFCLPSLIISTYYLKNTVGNPTLKDIKRVLQANLCRCSGYESQEAAVARYLGVKI